MTYLEAATEIGKLVTEKQVAYGDAFGQAGDILRKLYPHGVKPEQFDDMLCLIRIIDKMFRIANEKTAFGESPYRDITGYGLLGYVRDQNCSPQPIVKD